MSLLQLALEPSTLVVAVDPGKVMNRVWISDGSGSLADPVSMPVSRAGIETVERMVTAHSAGDGAMVIVIEATGSLHRGGQRTGAPTPRCGAAVRTLRDQGGQDPAGLRPVQNG